MDRGFRRGKYPQTKTLTAKKIPIGIFHQLTKSYPYVSTYAFTLYALMFIYDIVCLFLFS